MGYHENAVMSEQGNVFIIQRRHRVFVAIVFCLVASSSLAGDAAQANRLLVEAVNLVRASELEPSAEGKFALLKRAHDNLVDIVEHHPATDLAVRLATGQWIGNISLTSVREAMNRAQPAEPRTAGQPIQVWRHGSGVVAVAVRSRASEALVADRDGVTALHDIDTGRLLRTWRHASGASTVAVSPRGRRTLTAGPDGTVELREVGTGSLLNRWAHGHAVRAVALSSNGRLALVGVGRKAALVDIRELTPLRSWQGRSPVTAVAYVPDGRRILVGFADGRAMLGEAGTGRVLREWNHPGSGGGGVMSAAFSPDGRRVLTGAANRTAVVRDTATGQTLRKWKVGPYRTTSVAISRDGKWVLTGDEGHEVELHDVETGRTVRRWRYNASVGAVAFSPDSRQVLMGFADGVAILCEIRIPERRRSPVRTILTSTGGCW